MGERGPTSSQKVVTELRVCQVPRLALLLFPQQLTGAVSPIKSDNPQGRKKADMGSVTHPRSGTRDLTWHRWPCEWGQSLEGQVEND